MDIPMVSLNKSGGILYAVIEILLSISCSVNAKHELKKSTSRPLPI